MWTGSENELAQQNINTDNTESAKQLFKDVKQLIIENYKLSKEKWDKKAIVLLKKILANLKKLNIDNPTEKTKTILETFKKVLTKRLSE